jgi:hypothetical protein
MDPSLVTKSGKSEVELRQNLFRDMNAIDFKGDGETGEYGAGYISLAPVENTDQPFRFNTYDGKFRWYSFAIHGTNDDSRVGKAGDRWLYQCESSRSKNASEYGGAWRRGGD